jgi:hypothetical protein
VWCHRSAEFTVPEYREGIMRILLAIFMAFVVLCMISLPGLWDTKRRMHASRVHFSAPSEETRAALEEAKRLDRKDILRFELTCAVILGTAIYFYIRAKPKMRKPFA